MKLVNKLAYEFADRIADTVSNHELIDIIEVNRNYREMGNRDLCHTGDIIDSNMVMAAAFETVFKQEIDLQCDVELYLMNEAWNIAKSNDFFRGHLVPTETVLVIRHLNKTDADAIVRFIEREEGENRCVHACTQSFSSHEAMVREIS